MTAETVPYLISRRRFLEAGLALGGAGLLACARGDRAGTASSPGGPGQEVPVRGGRLRAAFQTGGANESLDPHLAALFADGARNKTMFEKLVEWGPDMSPQPRLAERLEPNEDGTRWSITLREAVFHDGRPVRPEDVLWSYARILDPGAARRAKAALEPLDLAASRVVGSRTLELGLRRPLAELPNLLAVFGAWIVPEGSTDFSLPVGSGPFRFVSFTPGQSLLVARFDDYWDGPAHLDEVEFLSVTDETARANSLVSGQVEYAHDLSPATARTYDGDPRVQMLRAPQSAMQAFAMKLDRPPFDNPAVRAAFRLLVDRPQMVSSVLAGFGTVGNDLFGKGYQYYAESIPQRTRDLDRARSLLRQAGAEKLTVTLETAPAGAGLVEAATVFADQAREAGVTVELNQRPSATFFADTLREGSISSYRSGAMPIESHISSRLVSGAAQNITRWSDPTFDAMAATAQSSLDREQRARSYLDMQRQLHERCGLLVWGFSDWLIGMSPRVRGAVASPPNSFEWARFDRLWLV